VQVPIVPSSFGLPTLWHCAHPLVVAETPSILVSGWAGRLAPPGWYRSENSTCSGFNPSSPNTAAHEVAA
jgi:hypothetical protein